MILLLPMKLRNFFLVKLIQIWNKIKDDMALKCTETWGMLVCVIQCNMIIVSNLILDENCTATVLNCVFISDAYIYAFYIK